MFARRPQYEAVNSSSEQHILTVLRFHEARLGKIEKHLINTNKQLQNLITVYKGDGKNNINKKVSSNNNVNNVDKQSFSLLKTMMENLTNQVVTSQTFMKEIKDVVSNIKHTPSVVKKEKKEEKKPKTDDYYTNHKLLELERDIAKAQLISIGMEPTLDRVDEYVDRMRRDRKRFLKSEDSKKKVEEVEDVTVDNQLEIDESDSGEEVELENNDEEEFNNVVLDESVLAQNIENIEIVKEQVKEEVSFAVEKIPVVIKPRKKRGRPKKKH
tara:strand:+ start:4142 stop:4951 length:810 start_codon:yes stop_codon:yes gene_type:complete